MHKLSIRAGRVRLSGLLLLLVAGASAHAVQMPAPEGRGAAPDMLDARVNLQESSTHALASRPGAAASGQAAANARAFGIGRAIDQRMRTTPTFEISVSQLTGGLTSIHDNAGALTGPAPGVSSETIVRGYLARNIDLFGFDNADMSDLVVLGDSPGGTSGLRMLRVEQQVGGRPVFQSETRFLLDREGRIVKAVGHACAGRPCEHAGDRLGEDPGAGRGRLASDDHTRTQHRADGDHDRGRQRTGVAGTRRHRLADQRTDDGTAGALPPGARRARPGLVAGRVHFRRAGLVRDRRRRDRRPRCGARTSARTRRRRTRAFASTCRPTA